MFSTIFRASYRLDGHILEKARYLGTSAESVAQLEKRINRIKLIGRIKGNLVSLPNGFTSFILSTTEAQSFYEVRHNLKVKDGLTIGNFAKLSENDLVQVDGEIVYSKVQKNNTEAISKTHVFAQRIVALEDSNSQNELSSRGRESVNEVKLLGLVGGEVKEDKTTVFWIVTNDVDSSIFNGNYSGNWHKIRISNENLRNYVRNNVNVSDRILIRGELSYQKFSSADGQVFYRGSIDAKSIQKLVRFNETRNFSVKNESAPVGVLDHE